MFGHTHQEVLDLHSAMIRVSLEQELGVRVNMTAEGCEGNGNTSSFYLDIVGMSGRLQHALVTCGVRTDHQDLYSHTHSYIVINTPSKGTVAIEVVPKALPANTISQHLEKLDRRYSVVHETHSALVNATQKFFYDFLFYFISRTTY